MPPDPTGRGRWHSTPHTPHAQIMYKPTTPEQAAEQIPALKEKATALKSAWETEKEELKRLETRRRKGDPDAAEQITMQKRTVQRLRTRWGRVNDRWARYQRRVRSEQTRRTGGTDGAVKVPDSL